MKDFGYSVSDLAMKCEGAEKQCSYDLVLHSDATHNFTELADSLGTMQGVVAFSLTPMRD
jgi:hypothetical protein